MEICQLQNLPRTEEEDPHDFDDPFVSDPDSMTKYRVLNMLVVCKLVLF